MRNIVNAAGEIVAMVTRDGTLIGGHHGIAVAASLGQKLFWKDTGEPVNLEPRQVLRTLRHRGAR
jgi:hypothetical protein